MQNLLTAVREFWRRKADPAPSMHIGKGLAVRVGETSVPFERDPKEWAALLAWLEKAQHARDDMLRSVLKPTPCILDAGTRIYRVQWQKTMEAAREDVERRPNYFGTSREIAGGYAQGTPPPDRFPFLIEATAKRPLHLANVVAFEVQKVVEFGVDVTGGGRVGPFPALAADPRFRGDSIGVQRWLVWEAACHLQSGDAAELDGVWDNDGADILITYPKATLDLTISSYPMTVCRPDS